LTLLKSSLRRTAIVLAGALIGLGGAAAIAAPASAHTATVTGSSTCNPGTGKHDITWTLTNDWGSDATVQNLKLVPGDAPVNADGKPLEVGVVLPKQSDNVDGVVTYYQSLPGDATSASVSFDAQWPDYTDTDNSATVDLGGPCQPPAEQCVTPDKATFHHEFTVDNGQSVAKVSLDKGIDLCKGEPVTLVSYYAPRPEFSVPQYEYDHAADTITTDHPVAELQVDVPDCNTQVDLFFGSPDDIIKEITENGPRYGDKKLGSAHGIGSRSVGKPGAYNGGQKACQNPAVKPVSHCDGTITVNLSNDGKQAAYPIEFTVKAGDFTKTVTVAPGKGDMVDVPAGKGDVVVSYEGHDNQTIKWEQPGDCALPTVVVENTCDTVTITVQNPKGVTPATAEITYADTSKTVTVGPGESEKTTFKAGTAKYATVAFPDLAVKSVKATLKTLDCGGSAGGGGLPVTGAAAGSIAAGAAALLIAGGVLFFIARRRRVTFTA
jgi:LPXTG-motif cell wall-anchored protein